MHENSLRQLAGTLARRQPNGCATHDDGAMEKAAGCRRREKRAYLSATARLTEDRDILRITPEALRVVTYPLQRREHVECAGIAGLAQRFAAEVGQVQMAHDVQALVDRHHYHVVTRGKIGAVQPGHVGGTVAEPAAVVPDHDRALPAVIQAARPDVERQAILAFREPGRSGRP